MVSTLYCFDFDETLMNTDRLRQDLAESINGLLGSEVGQMYLAIYDEIRETNKGVSIPLVLQAMKSRKVIDEVAHRKLAELFDAYSYQDYLYDGAEEAVKQAKQRGKAILFSDGDEFFQSQKVHATSIAKLVDHIVIVENKTDFFAHLEGFYPADTYVFIDDKSRVLDKAKEYFGNRALTIHIRQGRYSDVNPTLTADITLQSITEFPNQL